jgi:hypothetical protein
VNADRVLAETFAAHEHLAPDPADVLANIRRQVYAQPRRRRGRALTAIGAAIAVLAIAVGTTLLAGSAHHRAPVTPAPPEHKTTLDDRVGRFGTPMASRFVDRQHGFVLLMRCPLLDDGVDLVVEVRRCLNGQAEPANRTEISRNASTCLPATMRSRHGCRGSFGMA